MKSVGLLIALLVVTLGYTQAPDTLWTKTYGGAENDVGNSIQQTSDGGYIIAGYTESLGAGQKDVWLLKTDANGDTVWTKTYGGTNDDWATAVRLTSDSGYIVLANTVGLYGSVIWLIKTDHMGDTTWTKIHFLSDTQGFDVQQTSDGGYIITGSGEPGMMYGSIYMLKTDANGDSVWCNFWCPTNWGAAGHSVCETFDGGYIIAGWYNTGPGPRVEGGIAVLIKADANGGDVWQNNIDGIYTLRSVRQTVDSGYVACGFRLWSGYTCVLCLMKTDPQGDALWTRTYGDYGYHMRGYSLQLTNDNAYICTGACGDDVMNNPDVFLFKTDDNGDSLWCMVYGDSAYPDCGNEVLQTGDGGYIIAGSTESFGAGGSDVWIIKTEPDVGIDEQPIVKSIQEEKVITPTILRGPLQLPEGKKCKIYDITGRVVEPDKIQPGIYFIEFDGVVTQKVVKIR